MELSGLIEMSRRYGADKDYVLEGGGNTSYKEDGLMAVKASGGALGTIDEEGFVLMDVAKLREMTKARYPEADDEREACAIKDMMAARIPGQGEKRPSVECILHALFEEDYVLHVHPALINGLTCAVEGAEAAAELFADRKAELLWVPLTKPGFVLSKACADAFEEHRERYGVSPGVLILQNHGIFVAGRTTGEIDGTLSAIVERIRAKLLREPDLTGAVRVAFAPDAEGQIAEAEPQAAPGSDAAGAAAAALAAQAAPVARDLADAYGEGEGAYALFLTNAELTRLTVAEDAAAPLMRPFTPDHIVYDKAYPLWLRRGTYAATATAKAFRAFAEAKGFKPKVALAEGLGAFTLGASAHEAAAAAALLEDAVRIAVYSESFGGPLALPKDFITFIMNWEIESYRQKKSLG
jgi:rhamnose utilization protein RhaD (predicted bifunctional aldolase and dehydrogenase)